MRLPRVLLAGLVGLLAFAGSAAAQAPALPEGLAAPTAEPDLPSGLGKGAGDAAPPAPAPEAPPPLRLGGFAEARLGARLLESPHGRDLSIAESRLQLEADRRLGAVDLRAVGDLLLDPLADEQAVDLERGRGLVDLREANAAFSPTGFSDAKLGRQILTWGTGDLLFINDLFPKDWNSFFLGRDEAYLKAPSDAAKLSLFSPWANLDLVYTPRFDADRFVDGRRLSFFDAGRGGIVGRDAPLASDRPDAWFEDDEWALRLYRTLGGYEAALYGYDGFWKSPAGRDPASGQASFPRLSVVGASLRGAVAGGIGNVEVGYYRSRDDRDGDDPLVRNSELRLLLGYEREIATDLTLGLQYYLERLLDYAAYRRSLPAGAPRRDENRHLLTQRLTWLTLSQTLEWSLFVFYSPSDNDAYLRPRVRYDLTDNALLEVGGNLFLGAREDSFFGQFEENSNLYLAVRYSF